MAQHHLKPGPKTVHWGYFDSREAPIVEIASGDEVVIETVSGGPEHLPPDGSGMTVLPPDS